jgi:hypothetical protein
VTATTDTRTFYAHKAVAAGTYPGIASANTNNATGTTWVVCLSNQIATNATCNGGVGRNIGTSADTLIVDRVYAQAGITSGLTIGGGTAIAFTWIEDILMASFYHPTWEGTVEITSGTKWCSDFKNELVLDGTVS